MSPSKLADPNISAEELVEYLREMAERMQELARLLEHHGRKES